MSSIVRPALVLFGALTVATGALYPLAVTAVGQAVFADQANGSILMRQGQPVGSALIGQAFTSPQYFWGRPSATSPMANNASGSGGANLGPLNPALLDAVKDRIAALRAVDPSNQAAIPVDLVTASASGLDPHLSVAGVAYQAGRVARVRRLPAARVKALMDAHTEGRWLGFFGEPRVNILALNLALDAEKVQTQ